MKQYLEAGEIVTTHGLNGELKLYPWCDGAQFIAKLPRLFFGKNGEKEVAVKSARVHKEMCLVMLDGVESVESARGYIRKVAYFNREDATLPEGRFFVQDIIGCEVRDADTAQVYGVVSEITHPAAADVYTVTAESGERFLFPAVPEFLIELAPLEGYLTVRPIAGMFSNDGGNDDAD